MKTFKDLYLFLQEYEGDITKWLEDNWKGKDKQESLLRLFFALGLVLKLKKFNMTGGNFNKQTIDKLDLGDFFNNSLKDKGDSSDLTGINENQLLVTTSKNLNKYTVGDLDIDKILTNFSKYDKFEMILCIVIRSKDQYYAMLNNIETSNNDIKKILFKNTTIVLDWEDLKEAYENFKQIYANIDIESLYDYELKPLIFKMHQKLCILKTM
jgi:hypothetical protein